MVAVETKRGCGYRKVGAMYLCGEYIHVPCDRLPLSLTVCPVCGQGIKVSRGFTQIDPYCLWGLHQDCKDALHPCFVCEPNDELSYIMGVGAKHYKFPEDFLDEAQRMGISKRIPFIPKGLMLGRTVVYLAHPKAVEIKAPLAAQQAALTTDGYSSSQPSMFPAEAMKITHQMGIFCAFIPKRVEKLIQESEATPEEIARLEKRGITPIQVPDDDLDHGR